MPRSPMRTPRPVRTIDEALAVLRENGGRATASRRAVLAVLFAADHPLSAEQVAAAATPALDVPATYRNLEHLEQAGLLRHVHLGHGPGLYHLVTDTEQEYALCEACGTVQVLPAETLESLRNTIEDQLGLRPRFSHFPLVGLCARCRSR